LRFNLPSLFGALAPVLRLIDDGPWHYAAAEGVEARREQLAFDERGTVSHALRYSSNRFLTKLGEIRRRAILPGEFASVLDSRVSWPAISAVTMASGDVPRNRLGSARVSVVGRVIEADMIQRIAEDLFTWLNLVGNTMPPRHPNQPNNDDDDEAEDDDEEDKDREPAVIRE
jgi:hypothetical protein